MIPPANGVDYRIHRGYCYMNPIAVDPEEIPARVPLFLERAGYYFEHWDSLLENWQRKIRELIAELEALDFEPLPDVVPLEWITDGVGLDPTFDLLANYNRAIELLYKAYMYHFEFLNLGLRGLPRLLRLLQGSVPGHPRPRRSRAWCRGSRSTSSNRTTSSNDSRSSQSSWDVANALRHGTVEEALAAVETAPRGAEWLAEWEGAKEPWFNYSSGNGMYSTDKVWLDHLDIPLGYLRNYVEQVERGEDIDRPVEAVAAERERITGRIPGAPARR